MSTFTEEMVVAENYDGWRLDKFMAHRIRRATRSQVKKYIQKNVTIIPDRNVKPAMKVRTGDIVVITRRERLMPNTPDVTAVKPLRCWQKSAVVYKPAGIIVHRTSREVNHTLDAYLATVFENSDHAEATHRLDRETSGCVICALDQDEVSLWRERFRRREIDKRYLAIVHDNAGRWQPGDCQSIEIPLGIAPDSEVGLAMGRGDLSAHTDVYCHSMNDGYALLELRLHDGRQHQIRVHLNLVGTPIVGDKLYGIEGEQYFIRWHQTPHKTVEEEPLETPFHCLHAWQVRFEYEGENVRIVAELPPHMTECIAAHGLVTPEHAARVLDEG